jgi:hypothetical protein
MLGEGLGVRAKSIFILELSNANISIVVITTYNIERLNYCFVSGRKQFFIENYK